jgi:hypothetical protein
MDGFLVDTGQGGNYFKRLHTDTNPIAPHTTQTFALNFGTTSASQMTIQAGNTGPDSTQVCGLASIYFSDLNATPPPPPLNPAGTFTASNVHYNPTTHELSFHASGFSQPVTQASVIGITNCNTLGCSGDSTEFYSSSSLTPISDPHDFDAVLSVNSYRPSSGTVYIEFSDAGATYQRMWSQPLNYDAIIPAPTNQPPVVTFSASNTTINEGDTFTANGSFTDPDSTAWTATVDYGDGRVCNH